MNLGFPPDSQNVMAQVGYLGWTSLPCPACCHPNTEVPVPCCQPWVSSQGLPPGVWPSTLPRNFGDQKPPWLLGRASSFSRPRCCSPVSISAVAVVWNTQRASPRITTSWAWLPISELHEVDGIPYYLQILDLQKKTPWSTPPRSCPTVFLSRSLCKGGPSPPLLIPDTWDGNLAAL